METANWITVTILLSVLALLLQVAGYVAPMWIWLESGAFRVGVGLWHTTGCGISGTCNGSAPSVPFGYSSDDTFAKPEYDAVRALETLGLAGGVLLVLFLIVYRIGYGKWARMDDLNRAAFILCVLTWMVILAGLIVYCGFYWPVVGTSPLINARSFPWSLLLCLFAALLFIVICVLIRVKCRTSQYVKHAIPISGDAKMDLNPVTKTGLLNRYFTPSPYREDRRTTYALSAYYDDGGTTTGITRRLIGPEERHVSAIDNVAFQGSTAVENGMTYRYLPVVQNGGVTQTETVVRRNVPSRVVTYSSDATDINQLQPQQVQQQAMPSRVVSYVTGDASANQVGREGGIVYVNGGLPSPRDSGLYRGEYAGEEYATTQGVERISYVQRPVVTTTTATAYVAGRERDSRLADNTTDERFTTEGRLMANVSPELRTDRGGMSSQWDSSTTSGAARGQYTTHTLLQTGQVTSGTRIILPPGGNIKMYDPTYIYRPYSEQIY